MIQMRKDDFEKTGRRLPEEDLVIESDGGIDEFFIPVSGVIKEKFKVTFVFIDENDYILIIRFLDQGGFKRRDFNP